MIQLVATVTIGDGEVVNTEFCNDMVQTATSRDRLEAHRLMMILKARIQRFKHRHSKEG